VGWPFKEQKADWPSSNLGFAQKEVNSLDVVSPIADSFADLAVKDS